MLCIQKYLKKSRAHFLHLNISMRRIESKIVWASQALYASHVPQLLKGYFLVESSKLCCFQGQSWWYYFTWSIIDCVDRRTLEIQEQNFRMFYYSLLQSDLYITDKIYAKNLFFEMLRKVAAVVAFWGFSHYFHEHSYNYLKRITLENFSSCTYRVPFRFLRRC